MNTIKNTLTNIYLNNLITACNKSSINPDILTKLLKDQETIFKLESETNIQNESETVSATFTTNANILSESSEYYYLKPWNKLTLIHKIIKTKEFVNNLNITNIEEKEKIKESLVEIIRHKSINKTNKINYDSIKGKIISISCLTLINGKYEIILN